MLDVLLRGGRLVDGSGAPWVPGDVAIQDDRIVAVGNLPGATARRIIDVPGQVIAPGFIDCHTHSDWSILANRACDSTVRLGVTTEILGNCGFSHAPLSPHNRESISTDLARSSPGTTVTWSTFGEYLDTLAAGGLGGNVSVLVGHGAVRSAVMGYDEKPATPEAIAHMERLVAQALDEGALGLSTGLEYVPGRAASAAGVDGDEPRRGPHRAGACLPSAHAQRGVRAVRRRDHRHLRASRRPPPALPQLRAARLAAGRVGARDGPD